VQRQFGLDSSQLQGNILPGFVGKPLPIWRGSA
jgi:hypothetical protein